jgi:hypothetical protein
MQGGRFVVDAIITNVNEEDQTYEERRAPLDNYSALMDQLAMALQTLEQFPNDSVVITLG